jgi:hypothetical protein
MVSVREEYIERDVGLSSWRFAAHIWAFLWICTIEIFLLCGMLLVWLQVFKGSLSCLKL